jgi:hypothetical protein
MRLIRKGARREERADLLPSEQATIEMDVIGVLYGSSQARRRARDTQPSHIRETGPTAAAPQSNE